MPKTFKVHSPEGDFALEVDKKTMVPAQEIHCGKCGRFLGFQAIVWGAVKLKCTNSHCKEWTTIDVSPDA